MDSSDAPLRPLPRSPRDGNAVGAGGSAMATGGAGGNSSAAGNGAAGSSALGNNPAGGSGGGAMSDSDLSGAGGNGLPANIDPLSGDVCDAVNDVFAVSCTGAICHNSPAATGFIETDMSVYDYVGQPPVRNDPRCGLMIDPDNPEASLLLTKLNGNFPPAVNCGTRMPLNGEITPAQLECVADWLTQFSR